MGVRFSVPTEKSALPPRTWSKLHAIREADVLVGIPSYNCAHTINYVIYQVANGLKEHFPDLKSIMIISDGGSTDGTLAVVKAMKIPGQTELVTTRYVGISGKGTAVKAILEAAQYLSVKGMAMVDSDLRSISPEWMELLLSPTIGDVELVTPLYLRHKYDGSITNFVCYPFTCSVYGRRVRQPIGGDFGLSAKLVETLLKSPLWNTSYVPRFGIDIFVTHTALGENFEAKQALLGLKTHEAKDPSKHLASMFTEVVGSMFCCMEFFEKTWKPIRGSHTVPAISGKIESGSPEAVHVDPCELLKAHKEGFRDNKDIYSKILDRELFQEIEKLQTMDKNGFFFPTDVWARVAYSFAGGFRKKETEKDRRRILDALRFLWIGKVASFALETQEMDSEEAEEKIQEEGRVFEESKPYLLNVYR